MMVTEDYRNIVTAKEDVQTFKSHLYYLQLMKWLFLVNLLQNQSVVYKCKHTKVTQLTNTETDAF